MSKISSKEVRSRYLTFFELPPRSHKRIDPAPLVLEDDPTTLFTSAGMQPLVPYLTGEKHPKGKRLTNSQPSLRTGDIDEVGDNRHTTFFEMLGNWSLGDYFKSEQLVWIYEFFTKELGLSKDRLWVTVFEGDDQVPRDTESYEIWRKIGVPESRIIYYPAKKNWWSMTGSPLEMQIGHIGGPDSEVFYDFGENLHFSSKSVRKSSICHPNCECGRFLEIGNSVFIQYKKVDEGRLEELPQKNVDFGGGLERITAVLNQTPDIFRIDLFEPIIATVESDYGLKYGNSEATDKSLRIIADHTRAAVALISSGVVPSNKSHGYVLRRLIRRSLMHLKKISRGKNLTIPYVDLPSFGIQIAAMEKLEILKVLEEEAKKFEKVLSSGMDRLARIFDGGGKITGKVAFDLYQSSGFPLELALEFLKDKGVEFSQSEREVFEREFEEHKDVSRTSSAGVFKGGLADYSLQVIRLHTATHILLAALRKLLGDYVAQKGQNITRERSRFDFSSPRKLTENEIKKIEELVNEIISQELPVRFKVMSKDQALRSGATHSFDERYADTVKVYYIGGDFDSAFSKELCGGPHVANTAQIGRVRIVKQEKVGADIVRLYLKTEIE